MDINQINNQTTSAFNQGNKAERKEMGQQQFLQLLVAQMRHQDPINPLDGAEFAAQLAQFNSVEQLINLNQGINALYHSQELMSMGLTNSLAASLTGKHVKAVSDAVMLSPAETADIHYKLNQTAARVEIIITNESGSEVRREVLHNVPGDTRSWTWDGLNNDGQRMPDGQYKVRIEAKDESDASIGALTFVEGIVSRVRYSAEGVKLTINGVQVPIGDVEEVGIPL